MNALSMVLLAAVAAWFVYAVIHGIRHKGCGCSGSCKSCKNCGMCKNQRGESD